MQLRGVRGNTDSKAAVCEYNYELALVYLIDLITVFVQQFPEVFVGLYFGDLPQPTVT